VESPTMKRVGRAGLRGALWATLVWGGASGVAGVWARDVAAARIAMVTKMRMGLRPCERMCMGDRVALM
jgi:hypothetical protein